MKTNTNVQHPVRATLRVASATHPTTHLPLGERGFGYLRGTKMHIFNIGAINLDIIIGTKPNVLYVWCQINWM